MTTEQKAKAYDEAIDVARTLLNTKCVEGTNGYFHRKDIEQMFPILAESDDERIRKEMLEYCYKRMNNEFPSITIHQIERWLPWLEKQKDTLKDTLKDIEQKPEWSEEDDKEIGEIIELLNQRPFIGAYYLKEHIDFLKSLKDRVQPLPKQERSKKDEN